MGIAVIMRELMAAGLSGDALCDAIERIEASMPREPMAGTRSKAALRQERYRERKASQNVTKRNTVTEIVTERNDVTPAVTMELPLDGPPKINIKPPLNPPLKHDSAGATGWHRLPADWQPGPLSKALDAKRAGWPPGWESDQLDRFRSWAANAANTNGKGRKLDWNQAWHNWLRGNDNGKPNTGTNLQSGNRAGQPTERLTAGLRILSDFLPAEPSYR